MTLQEYVNQHKAIIREFRHLSTILATDSDKLTRSEVHNKQSHLERKRCQLELDIIGEYEVTMAEAYIQIRTLELN